MKKFFFATYLFSVIFLSLACNSDKSVNGISEELTESQIPQAPEQIPDKLDSTVLINHEWEISHVLDNSKMQENHDFVKSKLSFDEDGNYSWESEKMNNVGRWTLDDSKTILLLESSDPEKTSEWTVKHKRTVMVWVGTPKYGHHSIQMMMNKVRNLNSNEN